MVLGAVGAAVVGDDHFAGDVAFTQDMHRLFDAGGQRIRLIETRHDDGEFERVGEEMVGCDCGVGGAVR